MHKKRSAVKAGPAIKSCYLLVMRMRVHAQNYMRRILLRSVKYTYCTPEISNKDVVIQYQNMLPIFLQCK